MNLLQTLMDQLDQLNIDYTWDPHFEEGGLLVIESQVKNEKFLSVGMYFEKASGNLKTIDFLEIRKDEGEFPVKKKEPET